MVLRLRLGARGLRIVTFAAIFGAVSPGLSQGNGTLVWGGAMPAPGEAYRPSPSAVDGLGTNSTVRSAAPSPAPALQTIPQSAASTSLANDLIQQSAPPPPATNVPVPNAMIPVALPGPTSARSAPVPPAPMPASEVDRIFGGGRVPDAPREAAPSHDPWAAMKAVTPGAITDADRKKIRKAVPPSVPAYASLEPRPAPKLQEPVERRSPIFRQTPTGWRNLPQKEALCRAALVQLGVEFTEPDPIRASKSCSVPYPVKVTRIAKGVAMSPAATLNCDAAFRISRWVDQQVKPAARSNLRSHVTAIKNSSSYRCSRVAGSGGISQHASGNALDVAGFVMADGAYIDVEKKGIFSPREKAFQNEVRRSACRWFGTVLGPGYDYLHRNHFHLDARARESKFCR